MLDIKVSGFSMTILLLVGWDERPPAHTEKVQCLPRALDDLFLSCIIHEQFNKRLSIKKGKSHRLLHISKSIQLGSRQKGQRCKARLWKTVCFLILATEIKDRLEIDHMRTQNQHNPWTFEWPLGKDRDKETKKPSTFKLFSVPCVKLQRHWGKFSFSFFLYICCFWRFPLFFPFYLGSRRKGNFFLRPKFPKVALNAMREWARKYAISLGLSLSLTHTFSVASSSLGLAFMRTFTESTICWKSCPNKYESFESNACAKYFPKLFQYWWTQLESDSAGFFSQSWHPTTYPSQGQGIKYEWSQLARG